MGEHFASSLELLEHCATAALVGCGRRIHALIDGDAGKTFCGREGASRVNPQAGGVARDGCKVCALCLIGSDRGPWEVTYDARLLRELGLAGPS